MAEQEVDKDKRICFIRDYTLKSLRLKQDKWNKLVISDEQRNLLINFVEKGKYFSCDSFIN